MKSTVTGKGITRLVLNVEKNAEGTFDLDFLQESSGIATDEQGGKYHPQGQADHAERHALPALLGADVGYAHVFFGLVRGPLIGSGGGKEAIHRDII